MLQDRERPSGWEVHDEAIQALFAVGIGLEAIAMMTGNHSLHRLLLRAEPGFTVLEVEDGGRGFEPCDAEGGRLGPAQSQEPWLGYARIAGDQLRSGRGHPGHTPAPEPTRGPVHKKVSRVAGQTALPQDPWRSQAVQRPCSSRASRNCPGTSTKFARPCSTALMSGSTTWRLQPVLPAPT